MDEGLKKVVMWSMVVGVILGGLILILPGCASLGLEGEPPPPPHWTDEVVGVVSTANPSAGAVVGGLFAAYQLLRKRSRKRWTSAAKNVATLKINEAVKDIDKALGGGHTSKSGAKADEA